MGECGYVYVFSVCVCVCILTTMCVSVCVCVCVLCVGVSDIVWLLSRANHDRQVETRYCSKVVNWAPVW